MIPIYGFLEGDSIGLLIFAYPNDTVADLISKVQKSAAIRVKPRMGMQLLYQDKALLLTSTVQEIGIQPLEHFFVVQGEGEDVEKTNAS